MIFPAVARAGWMERAACAGMPVDGFVLTQPHQTSNEAHKVMAAKQVCAGCPVARECLQYAREVNDQHAIMGGLTPNERAKRKRWK